MIDTLIHQVDVLLRTVLDYEDSKQDLVKLNALSEIVTASWSTN